MRFILNGDFKHLNTEVKFYDVYCSDNSVSASSIRTRFIKAKGILDEKIYVVRIKEGLFRLSCVKEVPYISPTGISNPI